MEFSEIINKKIGKAGEKGTLSVSYKKTVNIRQYETEVVEASLEVPVDVNDTDAKLEVIEAMAMAKVEFAVIYSLANKKLITVEEYERRKAEMLNTIVGLCQGYGVDFNSIGVFEDNGGVNV